MIWKKTEGGREGRREERWAGDGGELERFKNEMVATGNGVDGWRCVVDRGQRANEDDAHVRADTRIRRYEV